MSKPLRRRVVLLGATGSIGSQACAIVAQHPDRFEIVGAVAGSNHVALADVVDRFSVSSVALVNPRPDADIPAAWGRGMDAACAVAALDCDIVLVAITGAAALAPTLAAIDHGNTVGLATKEVMVMAGEVVADRAAASGSAILPVDSEHSAIWQCLRGEDPASVSRLVLTASGGPFRTRDAATMGAVTIEEALNHPNWAMGPKVTVDSATMMNKGLELIEAHFLFNIAYAQIDIAIHPSSLVHSMVEFCDGATMAQIGVPDMRIPIALALNGGSRLPDICAAAELRDSSPLVFEHVDPQRFPAVDLARAAGERGGAAPALLNAANEVAVQAFLDGRIGFAEIVDVVAATVESGTEQSAADLQSILAADSWARHHALSLLGDVATR